MLFRLGLVSGLFWVIGCGLAVDTRAGTLERVPSHTLNLPSAAAPIDYALVEAFPGVSLPSIVALASPPGENNRLFVVEQAGRILVIPDLARPQASTFLDLTGGVAAIGEGGLLGLAFHPRFRDNGQFFVFYTASDVTRNPDGSANVGLHSRVSRFVVSTGHPHRADPGSETVILSQYNPGNFHNGGDLHFGPDRCLYVSLGDGGDNRDNSQRIDRNLFSGIIRIDVDHRPGSLRPNPHSAVTGHYSIPSDNPFVGAASFNGAPVAPQKVRTEFWAVGLRNPWRFSFDSVSGELLCGDVGNVGREEVNLIVRGGNYGWGYFEGTLPSAIQPPAGFTHSQPLLDYGRPGSTWDEDRTGRAVIGGVTYRGTTLPELYGKYVFGDWAKGLIWAVRHNGVRATEFDLAARGPVLNCFGTDPRNGDVLVGASTIFRLVRAPGVPGTLAATGAFADVSRLASAPGVLPYNVNVPAWTDHGRLRRWFSLPAVTDQMTFRPGENWVFPPGAVWIQHIDLEMVRGKPSSARRVETRLLVKTAGDVYGLTYRWEKSASDAMLVPPGGATEEFLVEEGGVRRPQSWRYPSRLECKECHTARGGWAVGFNTSQLNRDGTWGGLTPARNQILALSDAGYLAAPLIPQEQLNHLARLAPADDKSATVEHRVRSYMAANCAHCHPSGSTSGEWDARIQAPTAPWINGPLLNPVSPSTRLIVPGSLAESALYSRIHYRGGANSLPSPASPDARNLALLAYWITNDLVAHYVTNEFPALHGSYYGLLRGVDGARAESVGRIDATVRRSGAFSARLQVGGQRVPISGRFHPNRSVTNTFTSPRLGNGIVRLELLDTPREYLTGSVTTTGWVAAVEAVLPSTVLPGRFTWVSAPAGQGESFGTMRLQAPTRVSLWGKLADGTPVSGGTVMSEFGSLPIYLPAYGGRGSFTGWGQRGPEPDGERHFAGEFFWSKGARGNDAGFQIEAPWLSSEFPGQPLLPPGTTVSVFLSEGGLPEPLEISVLIDQRGRGFTPGPQFRLEINWQTGLFSGSFNDPDTGRKRRLQGVLLAGRRGVGRFQGSTQAGRVQLDW